MVQSYLARNVTVQTADNPYMFTYNNVVFMLSESVYRTQVLDVSEFYLLNSYNAFYPNFIAFGTMNLSLFMKNVTLENNEAIRSTLLFFMVGSLDISNIVLKNSNIQMCYFIRLRLIARVTLRNLYFSRIQSTYQSYPLLNGELFSFSYFSVDNFTCSNCTLNSRPILANTLSVDTLLISNVNFINVIQSEANILFETGIVKYFVFKDCRFSNVVSTNTDQK